MKEESILKIISEKEFWVGPNKTNLIEGNILHIIAVGSQTLEIALEQVKGNHYLAQFVDGKVNYLIDLNKAGKNSTEARKQWNNISEEEKTGKLAMFGVHPVARVVASFVMGFSKRNDMLFFKTKEDAIKWLKS